MFWGRNYEQREQQCFSPILVNDLKSNVILRNILHCIDYATITMFTMSRRKHCVYSFCTKISAFSSPTNRTIKSPKFRLKNHNLLYKYNPASEAIMQKRKPLSNYHIIEIMCCLCIFYVGLIISGNRLLRSVFIRSLYWNSYYLCIIYMALWK